MMENIMVIKTTKRRENVPSLQKVLTEYGCLVKMRLGLHEAGSFCSDEGLIILQLVDDDDEIKKFEEALSELKHIKHKLINI